MSRPILRSILELRPAALPRTIPSRTTGKATTTLPLARRRISSTPRTAATIQQQTTKRQKPNPPPTPQNLYPPEPPIHKPLSPSVRTLLPHLAAAPNHYITIHIHSFAYLVTLGDHVRLPFRMPAVIPGDVIRLTRASVLGSRDLTLRGTPFVDERLFECRATVLGVEAEPMRLKVKKKRRCRRKKVVRSKHKYTVLGISELSVKGLDEVEGEGEGA